MNTFIWVMEFPDDDLIDMGEVQYNYTLTLGEGLHNYGTDTIKINIDWGDGASSEGDASEFISHTYSPGTYIITVEANGQWYVKFGASYGQYVKSISRCDLVGPYTYENCTVIKTIPTVSAFVRFNTNITMPQLGNDYPQLESMCRNCTALEYARINMTNAYTDDGWAEANMSGMFAGCSKLKTVDIANKLVIGTDSFAGCTSLESVNATGELVLPAYAFDGLTSLKGIYGNDIILAGAGIFRNCENLEEINCSSLTLKGDGIYNDLFRGAGKIKRITRMSIDDSSTVMTFNNAFRDCPALTNIPLVIPESITASMTMHNMYAGCYSMKGTVNLNLFQGRSNAVGTDCFFGCFALSNYASVAAAWGGGYSIIGSDSFDLNGKSGKVLTLQLDTALMYQGETLEVEYEAGRLPDGFSVSADGVVSGAAGSNVIGAYNVIVKWEDIVVKKITINFRITSIDYANVDIGTVGFKVGNKFIKIEV